MGKQELDERDRIGREGWEGRNGKGWKGMDGKAGMGREGWGGM